MVTVCSQPRSSVKTGNVDATASFSGCSCCVIALIRNRVSTVAPSALPGVYLPSVPSETYDCVYFWVFHPRYCDGGPSLWTVSDGHCFHSRRNDSVCLYVT